MTSLQPQWWRDFHSVSGVLQAEDLVANFFPKKLLELDQFLKVSSRFDKLL